MDRDIIPPLPGAGNDWAPNVHRARDYLVRWLSKGARLLALEDQDPTSLIVQYDRLKGFGELIRQLEVEGLPDDWLQDVAEVVIHQGQELKVSAEGASLV